MLEATSTSAAVESTPFDPFDSFDPFAGPAVVGSVPTTEPQREIWAATRLGDDASLAFNEAVSLRLRGPLDEGALDAALADLVARHEALRATFSDDGATMLVCEPPDAVPCPRFDWTALDDDARGAALDALLTRVVSEPFDLGRGPLTRFELARLAPDDHVLVVAAHHIVCDGWSFGVIASELAALYSARRAGRSAGLPPADRPADAARELAGPDVRDAVEAAERYWLARFAGPLPVLDLPLDRPRPAARSFRASREDRVLDPTLVRAVQRAGGREGASLFAVLFAAFGALVHRLSGQDDVVIGIPAAGQAALGLPRLVGHCVNMLPVRVAAAADAPFRDFLGQARGAVLDALEHQQLTFGSLLQRLPIARDPGRPPLVNVAFNVDKGISGGQMPFDGLAAELRAVPRVRETFDLFLNAVELDGALTLECQYNADLLDAASVRRWLESYEQLLRALADDPATPLSDLPMVTPAEERAFGAWNDTARPLPDGVLAHHAIERRAAAAPSAVAVVWDGGSLTYAELNARANRLARLLRARGVRRGAMVGLCVSRGVEMVVGFVAILKAGATYVPFDPDLPTERLAFTMRDAGLELLVTESAVAPTLAFELPPLLVVDAEGDALAAQPENDLPPDADAATPDTPAYVIYTSGSTGTPKGCVCTHRGLANFILTGEVVPGLTDGDVCVALATVTFDASFIDMLLPLVAGARLVVAAREVATDGLRLRRLVEDAGVTFLFATPATYRLLLAAGWQGGPRLKLACGAEALARDLAEALLARGAVVWNAYGPTEATVWGSAQRLPRPLTRVTVGRPLPNVQYHVLDARRRPVPVGVAGELYIGGLGVAAGYLGRPELTAQRFLPDPFADTPGARLYRTGDVVRWLADGEVEYLGRNDDQVKLRGYRVELGEIESRLTAHAAVAEAAVVVREDRPDDPRLVAYVVAAAGAAPGAPDAAELRAHLRVSLPDYMIPQAFVRLATLPLTASGKVDRRALPAPEAGDVARGANFVAPRTATERLVAELWAEALRVGRVGVHDDFFQSGGHSLTASRVLARLRRDHGVELAYRTIFEAPTVEQFAAAIDAAGAGAARAPEPEPGIPRVDEHAPARLSVLQQRVWSLEELDPALRVVHVHAAAWELRGALDVGVLEAALADFSARHPLTRTRFATVAGEPMQIVQPDARLTLAREDLSALPPDERTPAMLAHFDRASRVPFDLDAPPLLRATLLRLAPDRHVLFTLQHALVWDGWSFDVFLNDLCELYAARVAGRAPALAPLSIAYADFAQWQRGRLDSPEMRRQTDWWRAHLESDGPSLPLDLPTDFPRPAQPTYRGDRVYLAFSRAEVDRMNAVAREHGATLYMLFLAAYATVLHRWTGQRDVLVGTPVRARTRAEMENVVGPFVNTVTLRLPVDPAGPFTDLLAEVRDRSLGAFTHQEMPFELLGRKVPVVRALFSLQDARARPVAVGGITVEQVHVPQHTSTNDLMLWTMEKEQDLLMVLNFSTDLFVPATAERLLRHVRTLLLAVTEDPARPVARVPMLPDDEREAALGAPAATAPDREFIPVPMAFERAAAAHPDAVAVRTAEEDVRFDTLRTRVAAVSAALRARGVAAGATVAVCAGATADRAAAVLGALACGAAVASVDPEDAPAYSAAVLAAAGVAAVLADDVGADAARRVCEEGKVAYPLVTVAEAVAAPDQGAATEATIRADMTAFLLHHPGREARPTLSPISHSALATLLAEVGARTRLTPADVVAAALPATAEAALLELLLPLVHGARLALLPDGSDEDGLLLADALRASGATVFAAPAATWQALADAEWAGAPGLTAIVAGRAPAALLVDLAPRAGRLLVAHGWAAAGVWSALDDWTLGTTGAGASHSVLGATLGGARLSVLDDAGELAPLGVPGWLHVSGPAVVDEEGGAGLGEPGQAFRTGERARRRADGGVELLGDDAEYVYARGARVALDAAEGALRGHPALDDAAVAARADAAGRVSLVAFVVPARGVDHAAAYTDTELRRHVRALLPGRAVPQLIHEVDAIPRDALGRADRRQLLNVAAAWDARHEFVAPRSPEESLLAEVWGELLHAPRVGVGDNFFDLGGYSLLCFRVVERVEQRTGKRLSPRVLLLGTLEQAAAQLRDLPVLTSAAPAPPAEGTPPAAPVSTPPSAAPSSRGLLTKLVGIVTGSR